MSAFVLRPQWFGRWLGGHGSGRNLHWNSSTLPFTLKLMKLGSYRFTIPNFHKKMAKVIRALKIDVLGVFLNIKSNNMFFFLNMWRPHWPFCMNVALVQHAPLCSSLRPGHQNSVLKPLLRHVPTKHVPEHVCGHVLEHVPQNRLPEPPSIITGLLYE